MVVFIEKALLSIIMLRLLSGSIEITAAVLMFKYNSLEKAFYINTILALIGPSVLILTTIIGLAGLSGKISFIKGLCILMGIGFIIFGLKSK
ncbi:YqhV family protein [Peribacillus kribbensis]|uniref:YqhV family protein n=1 Tax=Peribacillus kribbensis TaxID=356658 RepID=UPI0004273660|nr:YqhV family protein [Peribacillus kribbensis]